MCGLDMTNLLHKRVHQVTGAQCACAPPTRTTIAAVCFQKKKKQDDGKVFRWIFDHESLFKHKKDVEDDNHYSVLQIDIVSSRKYYNLSSMVSGEHSINLDVVLLPPNTYLKSEHGEW